MFTSSRLCCVSSWVTSMLRFRRRGSKASMVSRAIEVRASWPVRRSGSADAARRSMAERAAASRGARPCPHRQRYTPPGYSVHAAPLVHCVPLMQQGSPRPPQRRHRA